MTEEQYNNLMYALSLIIYNQEKTVPFKYLTGKSYEFSKEVDDSRKIRGANEIYENLTGNKSKRIPKEIDWDKEKRRNEEREKLISVQFLS